MDFLRELTSIIVFSISAYLVYDLIANGFNWVVLVVCLTGFVLVHYIWPKNSGHTGDWIDYIELIIDLPFRAIAFFLRSIGKLLRNKDADIGLDI